MHSNPYLTSTRQFFATLLYGIACYACMVNAGSSALPSQSDSPLIVKYPYSPVDEVYFQQSLYYSALLELVLNKSGVAYDLEQVHIAKIPSSREIRYLDSGKLNVAMLHTNQRRETELRPIRYPVFRGLSGWRILFIREGDREIFSHIHSIEALKLLNAGSGNDWPDTAILKQAGLNLVTAPERDNLYKMLSHGRLDYFPRSTYEIWKEAELVHSQVLPAELGIEQTLTLHYPTATYFFVSRNNEALAQAMEKGFEAAIQDGSYQQLFYQYHREIIISARFQKRRVIELNNPSLSAQTPLSRKELWFNLKETNL